MDDLKPGPGAPVAVMRDLRQAPLDHNPFLGAAPALSPDAGAGKGRIEIPGRQPNVVWQNRAASPTPAENALGDALERAFDAGAETAEQVVTSLNDGGSRTAGGEQWTVASFEAEMARLGA